MNEREHVCFRGEENITRIAGRQIVDVLIGQWDYLHVPQDRFGLIHVFAIGVQDDQGNLICIRGTEHSLDKDDEDFALIIDTNLILLSYEPYPKGSVQPWVSIVNSLQLKQTLVTSIELCSHHEPPIDPTTGKPEPLPPDLLVVSFSGGQAIGIAQSPTPYWVDLIYDDALLREAAARDAVYCRKYRLDGECV